MTTLYLVRHGETVDNAAKILQGQMPGELNATGRQQAREVAGRLAGEHFDAFVSSDLRRAIETCEIIASPHQGQVITTPLLRERDWGDFTGAYIPDLQGLKEWPSNVETLEAMRARAARLIEWLRRQWPDGRVLAVGHGIINKAIQSVYYDKPMGEVAKMGNAEVRVLQL